MTEPKVELSALRFSLSSIIATLPLICLMVVGWFNMDKRQTLNEHITTDNSKMIKQLTDNQAIFNRTADRLSVIVDELMAERRKNTWGGSGIGKQP